MSGSPVPLIHSAPLIHISFLLPLHSSSTAHLWTPHPYLSFHPLFSIHLCSLSTPNLQFHFCTPNQPLTSAVCTPNPHFTFAPPPHPSSTEHLCNYYPQLTFSPFIYNPSLLPLTPLISAPLAPLISCSTLHPSSTVHLCSPNTLCPKLNSASLAPLVNWPIQHPSSNM